MKKLIAFICFIFAISIIDSNVYAMTNKNGVEIDDNIYKKLVYYYGDEYLMTMTNDDYNYLISQDINNIKMVSIDDAPEYSLLSDDVTTNYKKLKIVVAGNRVTIRLDWLVQPKVKNYDIIAARLSGVKLNSIIGAKYIYGSDYEIKQISGIKTFDNGLGFSFKVPTSKILCIFLEFSISGSGNIYATYQHSTTNRINYAQSQNFYLSNSGLGRVLSFKNGLEKYYDAMNGVSIAVWVA